MKRIVLCVSVVLLVLTSCSKKAHPTVERPAKTREVPADAPARAEVVIPPTAVTPSSPAPVTLSSPMIVIDGTGQIISARNKLPAEIASKADYNLMARSFTPAQKQNLLFRFKMLPPRILYIPDRLISKSARGYYCIYKKKFWYWRKDDGLFYLDETYYQ